MLDLFSAIFFQINSSSVQQFLHASRHVCHAAFTLANVIVEHVRECKRRVDVTVK